MGHRKKTHRTENFVGAPREATQEFSGEPSWKTVAVGEEIDGLPFLTRRFDFRKILCYLSGPVVVVRCLAAVLPCWASR